MEYFDMEYPLSASSSPLDDANSLYDSIADLFSAEPDHILSNSTLRSNATLRRNVISILFQDGGRDPLVTYLAANYADRFLSTRDAPKEKSWLAPLLATACLSLACKMKRIELPLAHLQVGQGILFDVATIRRMENLILGALDWRMRSITPFSFFEFFLSSFPVRDTALLASLKSRASGIVFTSQRETELSHCKPSTIAASALLLAAREVSPIHLIRFRESISACANLSDEELWECCEMMGGLCDGTLFSSSSDTAMGVQDQCHGDCSNLVRLVRHGTKNDRH